MTELERIQNNSSGEIPSVPYEILRVEDIDNAAEVLENFKTALMEIINNPSLASGIVSRRETLAYFESPRRAEK